MTLKGRHWVMAWLLLFLAVATLVQVRQVASLRTADRLRELRQTRTTLEARRADLERQIRRASSRDVLGRKVERDLGLRPATGAELRLLPAPRPPGR